MNKLQINWQIRFASKKFWIAFIPAMIYLASIVCDWLGIDIRPDVIGEELMRFIEALFAVLVIAGITIDPTTEGLGDSDRAMTYHRD